MILLTTSPNFSSILDIKYSITSYVNGQLDIHMKYSAIVQGNNYPLHLFKDISHDGSIMGSVSFFPINFSLVTYEKRF